MSNNQEPKKKKKSLIFLLLSLSILLSTLLSVKNMLDFLSLSRKTGLPKSVGSLRFQLVDMDCVTQGSCFSSTFEKQAVLRLFGVTIEGASIVCVVHNFEPYFYARPLDPVSESDLVTIRQCLNVAMGTPEPGTPRHLLSDEFLDKLKTKKRPRPNQEETEWERTHQYLERESMHLNFGGKKQGQYSSSSSSSSSHRSGGDDGDDGENGADLGLEHLNLAEDVSDDEADDFDTWAELKNPFVTKVSIVMRESIYGYSNKGPQPFLKITMLMPGNVPRLKTIIQQGDPCTLGPLALTGGQGQAIRLSTQVFEANVDFILRFLNDRKAVGMGWVQVDSYLGPKFQGPLPTSGRPRDQKINTSIKRSTGDGRFAPKDNIWPYEPENRFQPLSVIGGSQGCPQIIHVLADNLRGLDLNEPGGSENAPMRILSFDIECFAPPGLFPDPVSDSIITIACHFVLPDQGRTVNIILQLGHATTKPPDTDGPLQETHLLCFDREVSLLRMFGALVRLVDPDVITGYNIDDFDTPYLWLRAKTLGISDAVCLGRVRGERCTRTESVFTSRAHGTKINAIIPWTGRGIMDMLSCFLRYEKCGSYSLNAVSELHLGDKKDDLHHTKIAPYQLAGASERGVLWQYCLKDTELPRYLMDKTMFLFRNIELCRVTGILFNWLLKRGQQIMVFSQILANIRSTNFVTPTLVRLENAGSGNTEEETYEGATVIEPIRGYYDVPVATLDFASMYPSIMMAHNLCYSSLVVGGVKEAQAMGLKGPLKLGERLNNRPLPDDDYEITPFEEKETVFVVQRLRKGVCVDILEKLIAARGVAKKAMENAKDPATEAIMNGRQLAVKVSANSVYGFTGASVGKLPCKQIGASVTAYGRVDLELTISLVKEWYPGLQVIYGDTDSVMIIFPLTEEQKAIFRRRWTDPSNKEAFLTEMYSYMKLGIEAAQRVSACFIKPTKLEFEKVYFPQLLINKKRYAALKWEWPKKGPLEKFKSLDTKGIELARRDNCSLVRELQEGSLSIMLKEGDHRKAIDYVKGQVRELLAGRIDMSRLVISKKLTANYEIPVGQPGGYGSIQTHAMLAKKIRERNPGEAPCIGDRIRYVIVRGIKGASVSERAEDPLYVMDNGLQLDYNYYLHQQLEKPLMRIFEPIVKNVSELFSGDHVRVATSTVSSSLKSGRAGLLGELIQILNSCQGCKSSIPPDAMDQGLCAHCQASRHAILARVQASTSLANNAKDDIMDICRKCKPHDFDDCTNSECNLFFKRDMLKKAASKASKALGMLSW